MARINGIERRLRAMLCERLSRRPAGRRPFIAVAVAALALTFPLAAFPLPAMGADGALRGVVRDSSGATVPGARVIVTFSDSDRKEVAVTNDTGDFSLAPLPDGTYNVSVAKPGFALTDLRGIKIVNAASQPIQIVLTPGKIRESVTVVGAGERPKADLPPATGEPKRLRVGGNVQAVKLVKKVDPRYPPNCMAEGIQGSVLLKAVISREGDVANVEALNKIVDPRLVEAAIEAVKQWKYQPTLLNGSPVEVITEVDVNFVLQ